MSGEVFSPAAPAENPRRLLAHQLYYERRDWRAALGLWSACEAVDGPNLDSRLAITHCRIEQRAPHHRLCCLC